MDWSRERNYPRPDYLSSSRKRLAPQLIFKGEILHTWKKKIAVALNSGFFASLPQLEEVSEDQAEIAWLIYDLVLDRSRNLYSLTLTNTIYTKFETALDQITRSQPGDLNVFLAHLQAKLDEKLENGNPPDAPLLDELE